ncbi:hypothetical protein [Prevotella sp. 10(H)]|uniref:LIC_10190 family membrane protein n=1 Tax=Prevotella sp. 10(H) TaxID=1158294 RepID=UPI0012DF5367|nr:hypothetical protein [Prevotella sp. 10(H)]
MRSLSVIQLIIIGLAIFSILVLCLYSSFLTFDPNYYHYQNIRWNEDFAVIPGLGNFEDRLGFNSNYLLLSSIFTLRFIFGQAIYGLQSTLAVILVVWILYETIKSGFELKRIILLALYFLLFYFSREAIADTSTDTIPNLAVFYLMSSLILYPANLKNKPLLYVFVLISLITFKLLFTPLCLISLYVIYLLIKDKKYKEVSFLLIASATIVILWLIRNVIITGYLIYPLGELDLFSFDWKMPAYVVEKQREYISVIANGGFDYAIPHYFEDFMKSNPLLSWTTYFFLSVISVFVVLFFYIRKRGKTNSSLYFVFLILCINTIYWLLTARDFRFCAGVLFSMIFFAAALLIKENSKTGSKVGTLIISISALLLFLSFAKSGSQYYHALKGRNIDNFVSVMLTAPYSENYKMEDSRIFKETSYGRGFEIIPYKMNDSITVFITTHRNGSCFDVFPCTGDASIAKEWKMQDIKKVEARGNKLQDGFRPKK